MYHIKPHVVHRWKGWHISWRYSRVDCMFWHDAGSEKLQDVTSWDKNVDLSPVVPLPMCMKTFMPLLENFLRNTIKWTTNQTDVRTCSASPFLFIIANHWLWKKNLIMISNKQKLWIYSRLSNGCGKKCDTQMLAAANLKNGLLPLLQVSVFHTYH